MRNDCCSKTPQPAIVLLHVYLLSASCTLFFLLPSTVLIL